MPRPCEVQEGIKDTNKVSSTLKVTYNRPSMLDGIILSDAAASQALKLHMQTFESRFSKVENTSDPSCIFERSHHALMSKIEEASQADLIVKETWLLFVPAIIGHRWCDNCMADLIPHLRGHALQAAKELINTTHRELILQSELIPLWFAATRVLKSGCVLIMMAQQGWNPYHDQLSIFVKCTEVLTFCAQKWKQGNAYCEIWRNACAALESLQTERI